jgi:hypothetical protein
MASIRCQCLFDHRIPQGLINDFEAKKNRFQAMQLQVRGPKDEANAFAAYLGMRFPIILPVCTPFPDPEVQNRLMCKKIIYRLS